MSVFAIILLFAAVIVVIAGFALRSGWTIGIGVVVAIVGVVIMIFSASYGVGPGEAKVLKSWTGEVNPNEVSSPGFYWKSPFEDAIDFDTRNQLAVFLGKGTETYNGSPTNGPQISFDDADGVKGNLDIVVLYSINPEAVVGLVENYQNQDDFRTKVIEQDIRSVPRDVPGNYTTLEMKTKRTEVAADIRKALEAEWKDKGIVIEDVSLQEVRYSKAVNQRFEDAQNAQTEVVKAEAEKAKAKIQADSDAYVTKTRSEAEANANNTIAKSLTPAVLQQRYLDVLAGANLIVVPQGFTALGQIPNAQ